MQKKKKINKSIEKKKGGHITSLMTENKITKNTLSSQQNSYDYSKNQFQSIFYTEDSAPSEEYLDDTFFNYNLKEHLNQFLKFKKDELLFS